VSAIQEADLVRPTVTESVYGRIKRDIRQCVLEPGRLVTEIEMVERYNAGRATIRTALDRLARQHFLEVAPRAGYRIAPITFRHVEDVFEARLVVEPAVARVAAGKLTPELRQRLESLLAASYDVTDRESLDAFLEANTKFHLTIAEAAGNVLLYDTVSVLIEKKERLSYLSHVLRDQNAEIYQGHHDLLAALAEGDGAAAERIMREHIEADHADVLAALMRSPVLQTVNLAANFSY
jgi:DNA-binding GntR family transcriptional regulator